MGIVSWLIKSNIKGVAKTMCLASAVFIENMESAGIRNYPPSAQLVWALSMRTPAWSKCGNCVFRHNSGKMIKIETNDNIKTLTFKVVLIEKGSDLGASGLTNEKIRTIIDKEVEKHVRP